MVSFVRLTNFYLRIRALKPASPAFADLHSLPPFAHLHNLSPFLELVHTGSSEVSPDNSLTIARNAAMADIPVTRFTHYA